MSELLGGLLSPLYAGPVALRGHLYDSGWIRPRRLPIPVISVGNLTAGGNGKTPAVATIAAILQEAGRRPVIVSRGYAGTHQGPATVVSEGAGPLVEASVAGDEPVMLSRQLPGVPVIVARRRIDGGMLAHDRFGAGCVVLDDGFQHRALARDLDLLLLDGAHPFGNGRLLPAGTLREPIGAMSRAHALVVTRADLATPAATESLARAAARYCPKAPLFHSRLAPVGLLEAGSGTTLPLTRLSGTRVCCFAGIASPDRFFATAEACGARIASAHPFADHHRFSAAELGALREAAARSGAEMLLTTAKDLARLTAPERSNLPALHALTVAMVLDQPGPFAELLLGVAR